MHFDLTQSTASYKSCAATSLAARSRPTPRSGIGAHRIAVDVFRKLGELDLCGPLVPEEYGGSNANEAVQIHGGYGYILDGKVARLYLDSKILEIGEATNEIQPVVIARALGC